MLAYHYYVQKMLLQMLFIIDYICVESKYEMVYLTELCSHRGLYSEWRVDRSLLTVLFGRESNVLLGLLDTER